MCASVSGWVYVRGRECACMQKGVCRADSVIFLGGKSGRGQDLKVVISTNEN